MGTLHQLPTATESQLRLLEKIVSETIGQHPDAQVARRWEAMAQETLSRYPGPPLPTQPVLDLDKVEGLTSAQCKAVHAVTERWLQSYFKDVGDQMMSMHKDLLTLQRTVAELESDAQ